MNALGKLNETLLSTLDRIADGELQGEELNQELNRAGSIVKVGELIVKNGELALKTLSALNEYGYDVDANAILSDGGLDDGVKRIGGKVS